MYKKLSQNFELFSPFFAFPNPHSQTPLPGLDIPGHRRVEDALEDTDPEGVMLLGPAAREKPVPLDQLGAVITRRAHVSGAEAPHPPPTTPQFSPPKF